VQDKNLAIGVSGHGSTLEVILKAGIPVGLVFADQPCRALDIVAKEWSIPILLIQRKKGEPFDRGLWDKRLADKLYERHVDFIALAGFMTILGHAVCQRWAGKMLNIHPSLLPKFPGAHAVRDTLVAGEQFGGCTVHKVVAGVDAGAILAQKKVPVNPA